MATLHTVHSYLQRQLGIEQIDVQEKEAGLAKAQELGADGASQGYDTAMIDRSEPASPIAVFHNV